MKLLITGAAGFLGARLARTLLARGTLAGQPIRQLVLTDLFEPPADLRADPRVEARTGPLLAQVAALRDESFDGVFHLASAVSGECELDFDLGMASNLDSTRALLKIRLSAEAAPGIAAQLAALLPAGGRSVVEASLPLSVGGEAVLRLGEQLALPPGIEAAIRDLPGVADVSIEPLMLGQLRQAA